MNDIYIITCVRNDQKIGIDISFAIPNSGSSLSSSLTSTASSIDGTRAPQTVKQVPLWRKRRFESFRRSLWVLEGFGGQTEGFASHKK